LPFRIWACNTANRIGHQVYSAAELKIMQKVITVTVLVGGSMVYLNQVITLQHLAGAALVLAGIHCLRLGAITQRRAHLLKA
jgi:uncharacterized protein